MEEVLGMPEERGGDGGGAAQKDEGDSEWTAHVPEDMLLMLDGHAFAAAARRAAAAARLAREWDAEEARGGWDSLVEIADDIALFSERHGYVDVAAMLFSLFVSGCRDDARIILQVEQEEG